MSMDALTTCLLDLAGRLRGVVEPLVVGGGFGLYIKQRDLEARRVTDTLISGDLWPPARATEDIDLLLGTELVVNAEAMTAVRHALDSLGFEPVVRFTQFRKETPLGTLKIDFLTGPIEPPELQSQLKFKPPRVRPRGAGGLHAHFSPEALAVTEDARAIHLSGNLSSGAAATAGVCVPGPFAYLLMKLHAFQDRMDDLEKQLAQHHALDLYRIVAMLTRREFDRVQSLVRDFADEAVVRNARAIVLDFFASAECLGVLRLLTYVNVHLAGRLTPDAEAFSSALVDLFAESS